VDGGYFENFGAVTGGEVLKAESGAGAARSSPVAILISNDRISRGGFRPSELRPAKPAPGPARRSVAAGAAPGARARGLLAASELRALARKAGKVLPVRAVRRIRGSGAGARWSVARLRGLMRAQLVPRRAGTRTN